MSWVELEFGKVWFWREGKIGEPREKPLGEAENQQQTRTISYKHEKGTPFSRSLSIKAIVGSTGNPLPGGREASAYHCSTLAQFSASEADSLVVFVYLAVSTQKS